ncbi:hypothetical protein CC86DRAFT_301700, partial [Ophiobolus disseminans]
QQELHLVSYIRQLTEDGLPPLRRMLRNYCMSIVTRFLSRYEIELKTHYIKGKDRTRHKANSLLKYELYFAYLHMKIQKYHLRASNIYNMDKKGFYLSRGEELTRIFSRDL